MDLLDAYAVGKVIENTQNAGRDPEEVAIEKAQSQAEAPGLHFLASVCVFVAFAPVIIPWMILSGLWEWFTKPKQPKVITPEQRIRQQSKADALVQSFLIAGALTGLFVVVVIVASAL